MLIQLGIGALMILVTVAIHAVSLEYLVQFIVRYRPFLRTRLRYEGKRILLASTVLGVFGAHVMEIWVWALAYSFTQEVHTIEAALYYSTVTFTTVGYGDITFSEQWRLLSSVEAANGMLLFGWSTAFIFEVMRRLWDSSSTSSVESSVSHA